MPRTKKVPRDNLSDALDREMLKVLNKGQVVIDKDTQMPVTVSPTAAMFKAIETRVRAIESSGVIASAPAIALVKRAAVIKFRGRRIPPLDAERDDAATA